VVKALFAKQSEVSKRATSPMPEHYVPPFVHNLAQSGSRPFQNEEPASRFEAGLFGKLKEKKKKKQSRELSFTFSGLSGAILVKELQVRSRQRKPVIEFGAEARAMDRREPEIARGRNIRLMISPVERSGVHTAESPAGNDAVDCNPAGLDSHDDASNGNLSDG
jgi:hypothetical protein